MNPRFESPRKLVQDDPIAGFSCGIEIVDSWVRERARMAQKRGTAVVYAVFAEDTLAGIYSLCSHSVVRDELEIGWLKRNAPPHIPTILLGMLGVDIRFQGMGLGASLLADAIERSLAVASQIGSKAILVDPVDDRAQGFYSRFGFKVLMGTDRMYLPLKLGA